MNRASWPGPLGRVVAGALVVLLVGPASAASTPFAPGIEDGDLVASAQADSGEPAVLDEAARTAWLPGPGAGAAAVSTASATCDGCTARAVTVQVVRADRVRRWSADADNVATAWATCHDCTAQAVAVQVVLVRRPGSFDVDNRALAVTAGCTRCSVDALAYQLVVRTDTTGLEPATLAQRLLAWARTQPAAPSAPPGGRTVLRGDRSRLTELDRKVVDWVGGTVLRRGIALRHAR